MTMHLKNEGQECKVDPVRGWVVVGATGMERAREGDVVNVLYILV
jgi:hypothetical protein